MTSRNKKMLGKVPYSVAIIVKGYMFRYKHKLSLLIIIHSTYNSSTLVPMIISAIVCNNISMLCICRLSKYNITTTTHNYHHRREKELKIKSWTEDDDLASTEKQSES